MAHFLDIVALGTVADVVPLDFNNRILVEQGIKRIRAGIAVPGINAILKVANRDCTRLVASDLGFAVGPRLNAAGRLDDMSIGIRCLLSDSIHEAEQITKELDDLNKDRKLIETSIQNDALKILAELTDEALADVPFGVTLYQEDWHQGVIGIVASRIKERLHRPTIVFAQSDDGQLKGSGRSVTGVHLRDVLDDVATQNPGLLTKFGGHAMAAGLSLSLDDYGAFQSAFDLAVRRHVDHEGLVPVIYTDGELSSNEMTIDQSEALIAGGPWGQGFPEPSFDGEFHLVQQKIVGQNHLKMVVSPLAAGDQLIDAILFNIDLSEWPNQAVEKVRLVYRLAVNEFRGNRSLQFMVEHIEAL